MVFERIKEIIVEELDVDDNKITMEARFKEDLGADSLDAVELVMRIEDEYNITIDEEVIQNLRVVGDIVKYIEATVK